MVQHHLEQHTTWLENQDGNLFFDDDGVSSGIDWDKAEVRSRGQEVVRAMQLSFGFDPPGCREFMAGYRSCMSFDEEELQAAAVNYGLQRDCELWL